MKNFSKITLFILCAAIYSVNVFSQAGALDTSFGDDGIALFDFNGLHESATDMVAMGDTTLLICGTTNVNSFWITKGFIMRVLPDGSQDMAWGTNGLVMIDHGGDTFPYNIEILPDSKILISGAAYITSTDAEFFLSRFLPDGTPDATFGSNGTFLSSYTTFEELCETMALQPDGKVVLAGRTYSGSFSQLLFARVSSDGTLDASFGTNGYTEIDASVQDETILSLGILSNGTIVGFGYGYQGDPWWGEKAVMAKLNPDGSPMAGFGTNGVMIPPVFTDISSASCVRVRNDSLFVTGYQYDAANNMDLFLTKMDSSGVAEPAFANGGISLTNINPMNIGADILLNSDQKIYVCGTTGVAMARDFFLLRYLSDGTLDPAFNSTGYVTTMIRADWDEAGAVDLQVDGKIVCAGMSGGLTTSGNNDVPVTRYLNDFTPSGCYAAFSANETVICDGSAVNYSDQTLSTDSVVVSWQWTFEGGTPSGSSQQHPSVTYMNEGVYDVVLIVYDGIYHDTLLKEDYISVETLPYQPDLPAGPDELCGGYPGTYVTSSVAYADEYEWEVNPSEAGTFTGNDTSAVFEASSTWTGSCTIKVRGEGLCGDGPWSDGIQVEVYHNPILYQLTGNGGYCEGDPGSEIILEESETGVDYELYYEDDPTGNIVAGTGSAISFGFVTETGLYDALGFTDHCSEEMIGQVYVYVQPLPDQPSKPAGPDTVCNYEETIYSVGTASNSNALIWALDPPDAGQVFPAGLDATVVWSETFTGMAGLSCHGENDCGAGPESAILEIEAFAAPTPEISGPQTVCEGFEEIYTTEEASGNIYTWEVTGGDIIDGLGTNQVTVLWGEPGTGTVLVTEQNAAGCSDTTGAYEVTIEECTFVDENDRTEITVYPNPASNQFNIIIPNNESLTNASLHIYNAAGEIVLVKILDKGDESNSVSINDLAPGLYFVRVVVGDRLIGLSKIVIN